MQRLQRYGFCEREARGRPETVLTHLFVHGSTEHLLSNLVTLAAALLEFGSVPAGGTRTLNTRAAPRSRGESAATSPRPRRARTTAGAATAATVDVDNNDELMMSSVHPTARVPTPYRLAREMRLLWGEGSILRACRRTCGAMLVWVVGGVVGGLGGQLLYNRAVLALRHERTAQMTRAAAEAHRRVVSTIVSGSSNAGGSDADAGRTGGIDALYRRFSTALTGVGDVVHCSYEASQSNLAAAIEEEQGAWTTMAGSSAGICALIGFNVVGYGRPLLAILVAAPDVVRVAGSLCITYVALLAPQWVRTSISGGGDAAGLEARLREIRAFFPTVWRGVTVGYAAHVGGFAAGATLGWAWRRLQQAPRRRTRASERA